jgi:hypothetical protein
LGNYSDTHFCDYSSKNTTHKNYLGNIIAGPFGAKIKDENNSGIVAHCMLDNGYYTLRIWDTVYPAEIDFELFLEGDLPDADLIVDHLSAPAIPNDGLGMFDHTLIISKSITPTSTMKKFDANNSSYFVNDRLSFLDDGEDNWQVVLNKLKSPECFYCTNKPEQWLFVDEDSNTHLNFRSVLSCKDHLHMGRIKEISSGFDDHNKEDYYTSKNSKRFAMQDVLDENNNKIFTRNIEIDNNQVDTE